MKKIIAIFMVVLFCLSSVQAVSAGSALAAVKQNKKNIMISIYDNIKQDHIVENTKISFDSELNILNTLQKLKDNANIKDYIVTNGQLTQILLPNDAVWKTGTDPYQTEFAVKQNGIYVSKSIENIKLNDGDIIEWIYSTKTSQIGMGIQSANTTSQAKSSSKYWNDKTNQALNQSTNWLHLNNNSSSSYLISMGIAGRTADIKTVNDFVASVKQTQENITPTELAKRIMTLTFCGYDAGLNDYGNLVKQLSNYENIMESGIFGAVNTLIAFDTNNYTIAKSAINSRDKLVSHILEYQKEDGGFSITKTSASDIDTTAMTITALANYKESILVENAIEKALDYLSKVQTAKGGFGFLGQENCESLSTVIIALNTLNVPLDDARFRKNHQSLADQLLSYQNNDGGFSHIKGEKSTAMPTEQAVIALTSIKRSSNPYILSLPISSSKPNPTQQASLDKDNTFLLFLLGVVLFMMAICAIVITRSYLSKSK